MSLFAELRRRNVFRIGIAYVVVAWLVLQVADVMIDNIGAPDWLFSGILLVLGIGFPIALVFAWAFEMTPEGLKREHEVDRSASIAPQTGRKLDRLIIGILAVAVLYLLLDKLVLQDRAAPEAAATAVTQAPSGDASETPEQPSVAVLPFVNMSGDPDNEYFSDGLTETLLHMLAQLPELKVAARTSSFSFKGKDVTIDEIANALGVANILEGSVQKSGDRIRVTAQLIRADDGFHIWSQNYTRPLEDIFAIQDEIATDVARALDASLLGAGEHLQAPNTADVTAYDTYLKAMEQQAIYSYASIEQAEGLFKQALATDPNYLDAKLGLARNYLMKNGTGLIDEATTRAHLEPLLNQVRAEQPDNALARALELVMELQTPAAMSRERLEGLLNELRGLLRDIPTESYIRSWVSGRLADMGQEESALDVIQAGLLLDPLSAYLHSRMGNLYTDMKRWDDAEEALLRAIELDPRDPGAYHRMSDLHGEMNDIIGRVTWIRRAIEVDPQDHEIAATMAYLLYQLGLPEEGDQWANRVAALAPGSDIVRALASEKAWAAGDWTRVITVGEAMIRDQASMRQGSFPTGLFNYVDASMHSGRARQGYDLLVATRPEVEQFATPTPDIHVMIMRWGAMALKGVFDDPERVQQDWADMVTVLDQNAYDWREDAFNRVFDARLRGDLEETRRVLLEQELAEPLAEWPTRINPYQTPLFAAVVDDPQVSARIAELERERAQMREQVSELMMQPEWWR